MDIADIRKEYTKGKLDVATTSANPIEQFQQWFEEYRATNPEEPTIMNLASVDRQQQPWQRIVLLKDVDQSGFVFFTNYESCKGQQLEHNPKASLHFFWITMERQIHIQGEVSKISRQKSAEYFQSRPYESQIGALVSAQSRPVSSRAELEQAFMDKKKEYSGQKIPLPDYWGGYCLKPTRVEFWQGGAHRLHDRVEYSLVHQNTDELAGQSWQKQRLNP